ncbi:hypothetical protein ACE40E_12990 [Enterococcus gallinarum]|uniref:hypothetical protein n=1 Tax=Enterococcus gallinarum TaxID=1353 RepID=UPI0035CB5E4A
MTTVKCVEENGKKKIVFESEAGKLVIENVGIHYEKKLNQRRMSFGDNSFFNFNHSKLRFNSFEY